MDIALPPAAAGTASIAPASEAGGGDTPVDTTSSTPAFGTTFTKHLADATDDKPATHARVNGPKNDTSDPSATGKAADDDRTATASTDAAHHDKGDHDQDDRTTDAPAAQLAVISQWLDVAKPVATTDAAQAFVAGTAAAVRAGLDAKGVVNAARERTDHDGVAAMATDAVADPRATSSTTRDALAKTETDVALAALGSTTTLDAASIPASTTHAGLAIGDLFGTRMATTPSTAPAPATPTALHEPVGSSGWSQEVGQVALRMAANDLQSASLRLNPEHLGPLDVQVRVDNGVTHVAFNAAHADTRQALEASRTTLDQMFSSQGIKIGDVSVGNGSADPRGAQTSGMQADASRRDGDPGWNGGAAPDDDTDAGTTITTRVTRAVGLVDTFA